ncbi:MAG: gluconate 2-dehydrogenase subunit 3 family protein, partial [Actinomycetota bacterium]|nr:gluconate 2-dehydrogenase subunit 3 family protein [Actinomycetota bacterium]
MEEKVPALLALNPHEARTAAALFERLFPADEHGPGATEIGVLTYVDRALAGPYNGKTETYRLGLAALDRAALDRYSAPLADCNPEQQNVLIGRLEEGTLPGFRVPPQRDFFKMLRDHLQEGLFADPAHGGNRDKLGWKLLGHPGICLENSAEENLSKEPVTKGGEVRSLGDLGYSLGGIPDMPVEIPGYDPQKSIEPPSGPADVVLVGVGAVGGLVAPLLARA